MGKISSKNIVFNVDGKREWVGVEFYYSTKIGFYALIPTKYNNLFGFISTEERKAKNLSTIYRSNHDQRNGLNGKNIFKGESEADLERKMPSVLEYIVKLKTEKRKVIIMYFNGKKEEQSNFTNNFYTNKRHNNLETNFALSYCEELKLPGNRPVYFNADYPRQEMTFQEYQKKYFHIMDDTKENREFLEDLYKAFEMLIGKLNDFLPSPEKLKKLITSKQKLLG